MGSLWLETSATALRGPYVKHEKNSNITIWQCNDNSAIWLITNKILETTTQYTSIYIYIYYAVCSTYFMYRNLWPHRSPPHLHSYFLYPFVWLLCIKVNAPRCLQRHSQQNDDWKLGDFRISWKSSDSGNSADMHRSSAPPVHGKPSGQERTQLEPTPVKRSSSPHLCILYTYNILKYHKHTKQCN